MNSGSHASELEKAGTVIARSLAFLCLQNTPAKHGPLLEQAQFLSGLGLSFNESAGMLGSTEASLNELARQAKKGKKGAGRGKKAKAKPKR